MRIIAGTVKGLRLRSMAGDSARPTSSRVREALFNILGQHLPGVTFLDLFAGSGAVGIEALSRGAATCVFVDSSRTACGIIRQNLVSAGLCRRAEVHCKTVAASLDIAARLKRQFDVIFVDPPYDKGLAASTLEHIAQRLVLSTDGVLVIEHSKRETLLDRVSDLAIVRSETYGDTTLSFYRRTSRQDPGGEVPR